MLHIHRILVIALLPAALVACGQKGALFVPTLPAGVERATLPQTLNPTRSTPEVSPASPAPAASAPGKP